MLEYLNKFAVKPQKHNVEADNSKHLKPEPKLSRGQDEDEM